MLILWILLNSRIEQNRCEFHLLTRSESYACFVFSKETEHLDKVDILRIKDGLIKQDYRFRVGINMVDSCYHIFKVKISCENKKHRLHL